MTVKKVIPQLRTTDLGASIGFYTEKLGFELEFQYQDFYAGVRAGEQLVHLKQVDEKDPSIAYVDAHDHLHLYLEVDDADATERALAAKGVPIVRSACDTEWGTRELIVKDDQGHTLYLGQRKGA